LDLKLDNPRRKTCTGITGSDPHLNIHLALSSCCLRTALPPNIHVTDWPRHFDTRDFRSPLQLHFRLPHRPFQQLSFHRGTASATLASPTRLPRPEIDTKRTAPQLIDRTSSPYTSYPFCTRGGPLHQPHYKQCAHEAAHITRGTARTLAALAPDLAGRGAQADKRGFCAEPPIKG
jgi:hypothetical protein